MINRKKTLIEERNLPEREGVLGSKTTSMNVDGSIQKEVLIPFCDSCGRMLGEEKVAICSCKKKICSSCVVIHENKSLCRECAKKITAITKEDFFVLYGLANGASLRDIKHASSTTSESLKEAIKILLFRELIESQGFSIFARYSVTSNGLAVLATSEQIYCNEGDVSRFLLGIQELLSEE